MNVLTSDGNLTDVLDDYGVQFSPIELRIPETATMEDWAAIGKKLCRAGHIMNWWIADWAAFGEKKWGALKEFARLNGLAEGTVYNLASIARGIETSRRREDLSLGHHEAVAALAPRDQIKWLQEAHEKGMSRSALRTAVRQARGELNAREPDGPAMHWPQDKPIPELTQWLQAQPGEFWTPERRAWWKAYLGPLVAFCESL